jgi:hypothetical protein
MRTGAAGKRWRSGLNPAGIIIKPNPAAEQRGIISNGVKRYFLKTSMTWKGGK